MQTLKNIFKNFQSLEILLYKFKYLQILFVADTTIFLTK